MLTADIETIQLLSDWKRMLKTAHSYSMHHPVITSSSLPNASLTPEYHTSNMHL